jgi:hypothetical protein
VTRVVVRVLLVSIALNAALAVYALLAGSFGATEGRILRTSLCVSGAVLLGLACQAARERGRLGPVPALGALAAAAGFGLVVVGIWAEPRGDGLWKAAGSVLVPAVAAAIVSLLSLPALAPRFRWTFTAAAVLAGVLAAMLVSTIWGEFESGWFSRWFGVVAVLLAAFAVAIPVLHRAGRREPRPEPQAGPEARVSFCPSCGRPVSARAETETACPACGAAFSVRFGGERR